MDSFEKTFFEAAAELEELDKSFVIQGVPEEYKELWVPRNEIRLWSIPRSSAEILKALVLAHKPKTILELGTSAGYSTIWLAWAARLIGGHVTTIELAKPKIEMAKRYFAKAKVSEDITQVEGKISEVLNKWDQEVDFVFLDADKPNYLAYIKQLEPFLAKGGVIVADNAIDFKEDMKDYLDYITASDKYHSQLLSIDHGLMISVVL